MTERQRRREKRAGRESKLQNLCRYLVNVVGVPEARLNAHTTSRGLLLRTEDCDHFIRGPLTTNNRERGPS